MQHEVITSSEPLDIRHSRLWRFTCVSESCGQHLRHPSTVCMDSVPVGLRINQPLCFRLLGFSQWSGSTSLLATRKLDCKLFLYGPQQRQIAAWKSRRLGATFLTLTTPGGTAIAAEDSMKCRRVGNTMAWAWQSVQGQSFNGSRKGLFQEVAPEGSWSRRAPTWLTF